MVEKQYTQQQQPGAQTETNILMRPMVATSIREALDLMNLDFPLNRDEIERKLHTGPGRQTFIEVRVPLKEVVRRMDTRNFNSEQDLERNIIETLPDVVTRHPGLRSGIGGGVGGGETWGQGGGYERRQEAVQRY